MNWKRATDDVTGRFDKVNKQAMKGTAELLDRLAALLERVERTQTQMTRDMRKRVMPRRRARRGRIVMLFGIAATAGYVLAYLFDPEQGKGRRTVLRDRLLATSRDAAAGARRRATYTSQAIRSMPARMGAPDNPNPDDNTLVDRVESELFADPMVPKGKINVGAIDGTVILRGEVDDPTQISSIEMAVRRIVGVKGVENLMHPVGTAAPNKAAAREAGGTGTGSAVE